MDGKGIRIRSRISATHGPQWCWLAPFTEIWQSRVRTSRMLYVALDHKGAVPRACAQHACRSLLLCPQALLRHHLLTRRTGISSDMYFGRGNYDPSAASEAQSRLQNFQGATAISSNAYFGREDEEDDGGDMQGTDGMLGLEGNETVQALERNVRDMAGRVMADPNVQNLTDQIRAGALRVSERRGVHTSGFVAPSVVWIRFC